MKDPIRAQKFAALGDVNRLQIVDQLGWGDLAVDEIADLVDMKGSLLAHHLDVLESAGLIQRRISEGDRRRRYVTLDWRQLPIQTIQGPGSFESVAFVCTHNSARSQFAAAIWQKATGRRPVSAGSSPARGVDPRAVKVGSEFGVDISSAVPGGYERIESRPDLVVGVCDRAWEGGVPDAERFLHWSVPDPVEAGTIKAFRSAFADIARRVDRLAGQSNRIQ